VPSTRAVHDNKKRDGWRSGAGAPAGDLAHARRRAEGARSEDRAPPPGPQSEMT